MPVDRRHAFALGPTEAISAKRDKSWLGEWKRRLLRRLRAAISRTEMEEVLTSFRKGCLAEKSVRLGPSAWCVNLGARESISLGANVICRGILRLENFQPARLAIAEDVYVGDDTTDEHAFALGCRHGVFGIRVGRRRGSQAALYLKQQSEIDPLLTLLWNA